MRRHDLGSLEKSCYFVSFKDLVRKWIRLTREFDEQTASSRLVEQKFVLHEIENKF